MEQPTLLSIIAFLGADLPWSSLGIAGRAFVFALGALLGIQYRSRFSVWLRHAWLLGILGIVAAYCIRLILLMHRNVQHVAEWDFRVFWIYGQLIAKGANVFDPASYQQFVSVFKPSPGFIEDVLNVGATYPPPTMFIFVPLGWFDIHTAYSVWYLLQATCLLVSVHLLQKLFFPSAVWGLATAACLIFCLHSSWETINFGQTNFLLLLLLLLYWRDRKLPRSGLWLTLAIAIKLYSAAFLLDIVVRRRWGVLAWAAVSSALLWLASLALLGPTTFLTYFSSPPASRVPRWAFVEHANQSLLAVVLRGRTYSASTASPVTEPLFLALGAALALATIGLAHQARKCGPELGLALVLVMGLLLYPGTLGHYALALVIPLLTMWAARDRLPGKAMGSAILAGLVYGLVGFEQGNAVFVAYLVTWISLALTITFLAWGKEPIPDGSNIT